MSGLSQTPAATQGRVAGSPAAGPGSVSAGGQKKGKGSDEPTIRATKPAAPAGKNATKAAAPATTADLVAFWDRYFKSHDESPTEAFNTIAPLLKEKKFDHAEVAIKCYVTYLNQRRKQAQPWMYEWLIKMIEARKGPESEVKTALGYAAALAKKTKNPNDLVRVADMMVMRNLYGTVGDKGFETNVGELIDLAAEKVPANAIPPMMSVNLAGRTKDSKRMGDAADRLLSLGWTGMDDKVRRDLSQQVELLQASLRNDGRAGEADDLARRVAESEIRDVYVALKWAGEADLDLSVEEPLGATCRYQTPQTVFGGAMLKNGYGKHPEEVYVCPRGFDGDYTIRVDAIYNSKEKPAKDATLTVILHEGGANEERKEHKIDLDKPTPVVVRLAGGRRKEVLPFVAPPEPVAIPPKATAAAKPKPAEAGSPRATPKGRSSIPVE